MSILIVSDRKTNNMSGYYQKASKNERYTSILPISIRREIIDQMKNVANSANEEETRRITARFEHAIMILSYPDIWQSNPSLIPSALHHLHLAAVSGYHPARSMAGKFHSLFGAEMPECAQTEVEWLSQASLKGSLTAMQRLKLLAPAQYLEVFRLIRCQYNGSFVEGELWPNTELLLVLIRCGSIDVPPNFIHNLAALGQIDSLRRLSGLSPSLFNTQDLLGETPLVTACRCGQAEVVTLLLELGADPKIATHSGVHALHFLSAFEESAIPKVAKILAQKGAALEAHCSRGQNYQQGLDGRFDVEAGTPLLWAVIAGNIQAIRSLLDLGADVFAYKKITPWTFSNDVLIDSSPLESAIGRYRFDIVELLLESCENKDKRKQKLNELRLVGPNVRAAPLLTALSKRHDGILRTALSYGSRFQDAQLMTVKTLIGYGANPLQISREASGYSIHPLLLVCQDNSLLLLRYLWNHSGGRFRPPVAKVFIECLEIAMQNTNRDVFDFLISHADDVFLGDSLTHVTSALVKACSGYIDIHYVSSFISLAYRTLQCSTTSQTAAINPCRPNFSAPLLASLLAGNIEVASLLLLYGESDIVSEGLLFQMIWLDACYPIATNRLDILLNLAYLFPSPISKEDLFWGTGRNGNDDRQIQLTALHFAFSSQANDLQDANQRFILAQKNKNILSRIIEDFHEPHFLNAQIETSSSVNAGDTALHIAAREGCLDLIFWILGEPQGPYFDLNLRNACNETVLDICLAHYETVVNELEDMFMAVGSLITETPAFKNLIRLEELMPHFLTDFNCNISAFCLVILRQTEVSFLFIRQPNITFNVAIGDGEQCKNAFFHFKIFCNLR